jgi:hypothetical protein
VTLLPEDPLGDELALAQALWDELWDARHDLERATRLIVTFDRDDLAAIVVFLFLGAKRIEEAEA